MAHECHHEDDATGDGVGGGSLSKSYKHKERAERNLEEEDEGDFGGGDVLGSHALRRRGGEARRGEVR